MFAGALVALATVKVLRLPTRDSEGVFDTRLVSIALATARDAVLGSSMLKAGSLLLLIVLVMRWKWPRLPGGGAILASLAAGWLLATLSALLNAEPRPLFPFFAQNVLHEFRHFGGLFWRDVATALLLGAVALGIAWRDSVWRRWLLWTLIAALLLVLSIDSGYFVAVRADLSVADVAYFLQQPRDVLSLSGDAWSDQVVLPMLLPWLAIPTGAIVWMALRQREPRSTGSEPATRTEVRLGTCLWPAVLVVLAAPALPANQREVRFVDNLLMRGAHDLGARPVRWLVSAGALDSVVAASTLPPGPSRLVPRASSPRLNVVLVLLESARWDVVFGPAGARSATPFLQQFAAQSLQVDQMYAVVPRTSAAWMATIAGAYPTSIANLRAWSTRHPQARVRSSLAALLRPLGYQSAFFVPTRLDFENDDRVVDALGFDSVVSGHDLARRRVERLNSFGFADESLLPDIAAWLDRRVAGAAPFFLTVMTYSGHYPYDVPRSWGRRFDVPAGTLPAKYLTAMSYADHQVEQVIGMLRDRGLLEQSLVIVLGDHGEAFNEHGLVWHSSVPYQEALRIPAMIRLPGGARRVGLVEGPRQQIDIAPTVADVLGLEPEGGRWEGTSLLSQVPADRPLFFGTHYDDLHLGLLQGTRKFIYHFGRQPTEVFDLAIDPSEKHSGSGEMPSTDLLQAEAKMRGWYESVRTAYARNQL